MRVKYRVLASATVMAVSATAAWAQASVNPETAPSNLVPTTSSGTEQQPVTEQIVVRGMRRALQSAVEKKRNASQIVDSIVAEDIGKLPMRTWRRRCSASTACR